MKFVAIFGITLLCLLVTIGANPVPDWNVFNRKSSNAGYDDGYDGNGGSYNDGSYNSGSYNGGQGSNSGHHKKNEWGKIIGATGAAGVLAVTGHKKLAAVAGAGAAYFGVKQATG